MEKNLPEIIFASSDKSISKKISQMVKNGKIRKLFPRVYTSNPNDSAIEIVRRNIYQILGGLYPEAIISHRSALKGGLVNNRVIFLSYKYTKKVNIPGIVIRLQKGPAALPDDKPFINNLYISSLARALLENMQASRDRGDLSKTLPIEEIEQLIEKQIKIHGNEKINQIRDRAREISDIFNWQKEFKKLSQIMSAMLKTHASKILKSPVALARAFGMPYDEYRLALFQKLYTTLINTELPYRKQKAISESSWINSAFIEAYFSNFIEGTELSIEEAEEIIFNHKIPDTRPEDAHDILGTYKIVSDKYEMNVIPDSFEHLIELLKGRHTILMSDRRHKNPGQFKGTPNRAGQTEFVSPELVKGTLKKGFEIYQAIEEPFARAIYMMFLISEIHPFNDGNGRIARIMMNADLHHFNLVRIIIPTVFRDDYLESLRALSRSGLTRPIIKMADRAQQFTSEINFDDLDNVLVTLKKCNAFDDHNTQRLILPHDVQ